MAPSARLNAHPSRPTVELEYWTAQPSDQRLIAKWINENVDDHFTFYACFINWCGKHVQKLKDPRSKYNSEADKVKAEKLREVLRQEPLDVREFIGLMESYSKFEWHSGNKTGLIGMPHKAKPIDIMEGDKGLRQIVWTERERLAKMVANGEEAPNYKLAIKLDKFRQELKEAEEEAKKAEEERKLAQQQWKEIKDAMDDVEEEIEVDDTTAAMGGFAISQQQPWKGDLADRTRE